MKSQHLSFSIITGIFVLFTSCQKAQDTPKNIILMIGDGMGLAHIHAGMVVNGHLNIERCNYVGLQKTHCSDKDITDSGASATAMSSGIKTLDRSVGLDPDGQPVKTILEMGEEQGMSTGLIAITSIAHATPAGFAAHRSSRDDYEDIALDISRSNADLLIGGGIKHFTRRKDGKNLLDSLAKAGYFVSDDPAQVPDEHKGGVVVLTDPGDMPLIQDGRGDILARSTELATRRLSRNSSGFFLMVEGSMIDKRAHKNDLPGVVAEMIDFDMAVGKALDFALEDGETLVIVTADHETGGLTILGGGPLDPELEGHFSSGDHTGIMVPVFAMGPGAEEFTGIYDNTAIFHKMKSLLGL